MDVRVVCGEERHLKEVCDIFDDNYKILGLPNLPALREAIQKRELFVAEVEKEVVGFLEFHARKDRIVTLYHIGVKKGWKKKGIGRILIQEFIRFCKEKQYYEIRLLCPVWAGVDRFYQRTGFECIGKTTKTNRKGVSRDFTIWRYRLNSGKIKPLF